MPFQQMIGDTNPDSPQHWLYRRAQTGSLKMLESRHEDNPVLFDSKTGTWTKAGVTYLATLDRLTGPRKDRLRHGKWVQAEGVVYPEFDRAVHLIDPFPIPADWRRIRTIDFGYANPFVCLWIAFDPDDRAYVYRELYMTQRTVKKHADQIRRLTSEAEEAMMEYTVADHDAEDRATLREENILTIPARKATSPGREAVAECLTVQGDGKPRLMFFRDCLVERDQRLVEAKRPVSIIEEFDSYVWPKGQDGKAIKEEPVKEYDHGMDALRYAVMSMSRYLSGAVETVDEAERRADAEDEPEPEYKPGVDDEHFWE
jgi:phage terminase large subunit